MVYKCIPAPEVIKIDKELDISNRKSNQDKAVRSFAEIINREAINGWKFHSMENIAIKENPGCLGALFGRKSETTYFNMLVFSNENDNAITNKFIPTHRVKLITDVEGLKIRNEPVASKEFITKIPNGTEVQYLNTGTEAILNDVKAPFFEIITKNNIKGWVFSGHLEKI